MPTVTPTMRRFDMRDELRATADRRKRRPQEATVVGHVVGSSQVVEGRVVGQPAGRPEGIPDIAARLKGMFPELPEDTLQAVLSSIFRVDPHVSREELADRAVAALLEMSMSAEPEKPQAITSFGPVSVTVDDVHSVPSSRCEEAEFVEDSGASGSSDAIPQSGEDAFEQALDEGLASLLALPDEDLQPCASTLAGILARIAESPGDARVRRLRRANAKFEAQVGRHPSALDLLRLAGFQDDTEGGEAMIIFRGDPSAASSSFAKVHESIKGILEDLGLPRPTSPPAAPPAAVVGAARPPTAADNRASLVERRRRVAELTEERLKDPRAFREAAQRRGAGNRAVVRPFRAAPAPAAAAPSRRAQHFTLADVERMRISDEIANMPSYAAEYERTRHAGPAGSYSGLLERQYDPALIARQALDGTNAYRASKGLAPLRWNDGISEIARKHAEQMARGEMPFSHDGFDGRVAAFPVAHRSAGENLALNKGVSEVAKAAVDGWIKSPGHEKNLRGAFNLCGIGVARSADGTFYLTQLFANAM